MTPEIARWLLDEVLPQIRYEGSPADLRPLIDRHDRAVAQLKEAAESDDTPQED